jgi:uncharacterized protein
MNCPRCKSALNMSERKGVEVDICPLCRGVWLDRGELDKIINRYDAFDEEENRRNWEEYRQRQEPRRKSFWQEMFD